MQRHLAAVAMNLNVPKQPKETQLQGIKAGA